MISISLLFIMCVEVRHIDAFNQELDKYFFHH